MTSRTTTLLAVLGVLAVEPGSGYHIRESIRESLGHFWSESFGQIYPTLAVLLAEGLVQMEPTNVRNSKVYTITETGTAHLRELLEEDFTQRPPREETLLRLFFGRFMGVDRSAGLVEDSLSVGTRLLEELAALRQVLEREHVGDPDLPYWLLTVRYGELIAQAKVDWAREAAATLRRGTS